MLDASVHTFGVPARLLGSTLSHLPVSTGEFRVFMVYVLMGSVVSAIVYLPLQMSGASLCSLDASDCFPRLSVAITSRLALTFNVSAQFSASSTSPARVFVPRGAWSVRGRQRMCCLYIYVLNTAHTHACRSGIHPAAD